MHRIITAIAACGLTLGALQAAAQTRELGASGELLDGIAALVDTGVVLKSEVRERAQTVADNFIRQQMQLPPAQRGQLPPLSVLEDQVLDQLIVEEIQLQRAATIGIRIGDDVLNQVLAEYAGSAGTTLDQLPALLAAEGEDYQQFREDWRRDLSIRQLERVEVIDSIAINERELEQCLLQAAEAQTEDFEYNILHILIGFAPDASADEIAAAEDRIREIERQLDEGADFAQLAIAYSDGQMALEGGTLGWLKGGALPTRLASDVRRLDIGEHSPPIRSPSGFHLVRLNDIRGTEPELVDQIRVRHILLTPTEVLDNDATEQRLMSIRQQIVDGDDFGAVAAAFSEDPVSAVDGGDLRWLTSADLANFDPVFSEMVQALEIGELSEPFRTSSGWHIAEVTDQRSYDMTDELRENECRNQIGDRKLVEEREVWRRRIRDEAYVVKRL